MVIIPRKTQAVPKYCGVFRGLFRLMSDMIISDLSEQATEPSLFESSPEWCYELLPEDSDILEMEIWVYSSCFKTQGLVADKTLQHVVGFPLRKASEDSRGK